jgi:hypothetical protein
MKTLREALHGFFLEGDGFYLYEDDADQVSLDGSISLIDLEKAINAWITEGVAEFARVKGVKVDDVLRKFDM